MANIVSDTTTPSVTIISPEDGALVSKSVKVRVQADDDTRLVQLDLHIDGNLMRTTNCDASLCEMQVPWNTRKATSGSHTVTATAYDEAGNEGMDSIIVMVK